LVVVAESVSCFHENKKNGRKVRWCLNALACSRKDNEGFTDSWTDETVLRVEKKGKGIGKTSFKEELGLLVVET